MASARHEEILEAALEVFAERGYRGASIDAVAERAGLTRQGVLHYYPSKKRLLFAMMRLREDLNRRHVHSDWNDPDMPSRLAEALAFDQGIPSLAQVHSVVMAEAATGQEPARGFARERYRELIDMLTEGFTGRFGERLPSGLTPRTAATALMALFEGMQQQWMVDSDDERYQDTVRETMAVLLLGAEPAGERPTDTRPTGTRSTDTQPADARPASVRAG
ncbi:MULTISPECIES: TetR/AcrR family transcriptional regulator [unclassified Streptomyces]|uniref:TetR/AcrR family transcriptional regulator n=1 Tax=unclassified Streptomyces TaxID=2593676 RepID=UPI002E19A740|nr:MULTISPECIES: TetR/AcrR family transcriptional regulator [unclassified Streptomyces]